MAPGIALESLPFNLTDTDREVLSQTDEEFVYHDWENLKDIIARNDLAALKRKPSDLIRYITWTRQIKAEYGSILNYICQRRLGWDFPATTTTTTANVVPDPFSDPADYRILRNDWPYGVSPGITHLVVWLRNPVPVKADGGDMTDEARGLVEGFVKRTFVEKLQKEGFQDAAERVLWFKNWTALQSVRALEHVHVLVRDVPEEILVEWTGESGAK